MQLKQNPNRFYSMLKQLKNHPLFFDFFDFFLILGRFLDKEFFLRLVILNIYYIDILLPIKDHKGTKI